MKTLIIAQLDSKELTPAEILALRKEIFCVLARAFNLPDSEGVVSVDVRVRQFENVLVDTKDLGVVNTSVSASDKEVRVWCCGANGASIFRLKALGKVHVGLHDIIVVADKS